MPRFTHLLVLISALASDRTRLAQENIEALPGDGDVPRYLHRDRDSIYGRMFKKKIKAMGIQEVISARKPPWQNPDVERLIGSIRGECTDHIIALGERHMHLECNAPEPRPVEDGLGAVVATQHLGGLHHRCGRAA